MTNETIEKAVILAAGMGTRLGELTRNRPKVMVPIAGKPMLEHHVEWMRAAGVREFFHGSSGEFVGNFGNFP